MLPYFLAFKYIALIYHYIPHYRVLTLPIIRYNTLVYIFPLAIHLY